MRWNYHLKVLLSQYRRTLMTLGKLRFSDISFSTYSKHQMIMYQLKWLSRSQETLGKYLVHYCLNIFAYCEKCRGLRIVSPLSGHNIRNKNCQVFVHFSVLVFTLDHFLEIKLLSISYNYQSRINISMYASTENNIKFFNL